MIEISLTSNTALNMLIYCIYAELMLDIIKFSLQGELGTS